MKIQSWEHTYKLLQFLLWSDTRADRDEDYAGIPSRLGPIDRLTGWISTNDCDHDVPRAQVRLAILAQRPPMEQIAEVKPHYVQVQLDFHVFWGTRASPETAKHNARIGHDGLARLLSFLEEHHTSGAKIFLISSGLASIEAPFDWTFEAVYPARPAVQYTWP